MSIWAMIPLLVAFDWVPPVPLALVQAEFRPAAAYGSGHRGMDLSAAPGSAVRAVAEATVAVAGPVAGKPVIVLLVEDPTLGRVRVTYEPVIPEVDVGDLVRAGQQIGTLAAGGGHCGHPPHCLHLGIKQNGRYMNPAPLISSGRVVLKPLS